MMYCSYASSGTRVEQLPSTPISLASGNGLLLELPGPKGVKVRLQLVCEYPSSPRW